MSSSRKRLRFDRAEVELQAAGQTRVRVTFALGEEAVQAEAAGPAEGIGPLRTAATATLKAVQESAGNHFTCALSDIDHVKALGKSLIAVLVNVNFQDRDVQVFGSCQIGDNEIDCAVKAALNAINRIFELAMRES